ncbi:MAG: lipid II:glycine glycyltransferase FemX [Cohaesibacteraceae bacterium]
MAYFDVSVDSVPDDLLESEETPTGRGSVEGFQVREVADNAWDNLAAGFRDVVLEQTDCFNVPRWGPECLKRLAFYENGALVAAVSARTLSIPGTMVPFTVVRWGPMWRSVETEDCPDRLPRLYSAVRQVLADQQAGFLILFPHSDPAHSAGVEQALHQAGFRAQKPSTAPERYFVSLEGGQEAVKASLSQKWRYNLKKALKNGLTVDWETTSGGLSTFYDLYEQMVERKHFWDQSPIDTLETLITRASTPLRPEIVLVRKDGEPVAGAVIDMSGERAIYLFGASSRAALPLRAGYLMQWAVIERLTAMPQLRWYDLGGADSAGSSLHQFKRGLAGKNGVISDQPPMYVCAGSPLAFVLGHGALAARSAKQALAHGLHTLRYGSDGKTTR